MKSYHLFTCAAAVAALGAAAPDASAAATYANAYVGATNGTQSLPEINQDSSVGTAADAYATAYETFSGFDRDGNDREMTLDTEVYAEAGYGRLRTYVQGTLFNSFYNESNTPFYDGEETNYDGVPDQFGSLANVRFTDTLQYGGDLTGTYRARYTFFVHGTTAGTDIYAYLDARIGNNPVQEFTVDTSGGGPIAQYFTTEAYEISTLYAQEVDVRFSTQWNPATAWYPDGTDVYGMGDFDSTVTLAAITLLDEADNVVANYSVTGESGAAYPVPEPASLTLLGLGLAALSRRGGKRE